MRGRTKTDKVVEPNLEVSAVKTAENQLLIMRWKRRTNQNQRFCKSFRRRTSEEGRP